MRQFDETRNSSFQPRNNQRPKISMPKISMPKREKVKLWSHQDLLMSWKGKKIVLVRTDGSEDKGRLVEADQFTLLVVLDDMAHCQVIINKSSLTEYYLAREQN